MPGPGLDLVGDEELAELTDVIRSGRSARYGPDDGTFPAKVRHFEEAVAERAGVRHALAVNSGTSAALPGPGRPGRRPRRRGHRARLHVRGQHLLDRLRPGPAGARRGR